MPRGPTPLTDPRLCTTCGQWKPLDGFYMTKGRPKRICIPCDNARMVERRRRLREEGVRLRGFEASDDLMGEVEWVAERRNQPVRQTIVEALQHFVELERRREQQEWRRRYPAGTNF